MTSGSMRLVWWACACVWWLMLATTTNAAPLARVHTVFSAECNSYFDWQSIGLVHSFEKSGMSKYGPITRLLACNSDHLSSYKYTSVTRTHVHPSYTLHPVTGDWYPPYNKPWSVTHWLEHGGEDIHPETEYVIILDADMLIRAPIIPEELGAKRGTAVSARYGYLDGVKNEMIHHFLPEDLIPIAAQVGGFMIFHIDDIRKAAPLWLEFTEKVRAPESAPYWNMTGDVYVSAAHPKPWISEMYGYVFGTATAHVKHVTNDELMIYPGYAPRPGQEPAIIHYGLEFVVNAWRFDKHDHTHEDMLACPGKIFLPMPPRDEDITEPDEGLRRGQYLSVECIDTLNAALAQHHQKVCNNNQFASLDFSRAVGGRNMRKVGGRLTDSQADALKLRGVVDNNNNNNNNNIDKSVTLPCKDDHEKCIEWAQHGECDSNPTYMLATCRLSCKACVKSPDDEDVVVGVDVANKQIIPTTTTTASDPKAVYGEDNKKPDSVVGNVGNVGKSLLLPPPVDKAVLDEIKKAKAEQVSKLLEGDNSDKGKESGGDVGVKKVAEQQQQQQQRGRDAQARRVRAPGVDSSKKAKQNAPAKVVKDHSVAEKAHVVAVTQEAVNAVISAEKEEEEREKKQQQNEEEVVKAGDSVEVGDNNNNNNNINTNNNNIAMASTKQLQHYLVVVWGALAMLSAAALFVAMRRRRRRMKHKSKRLINRTL